jgi:hypothetical protein
MTKVELIEKEIEALPEEDFAQLREWFSGKDWNIWDKEIESDSDSGRLDFLINEARDAKKFCTFRWVALYPS